jgi:hypothetical protein
MPSFVNLFKTLKHFPSFKHEPIVHNNLVHSNCSTLALKNTIIKRKHNNMFFHILESTNKNNKGILNAIERVNDNQCDIGQHHSKVLNHNFKKHLYMLS